ILLDLRQNGKAACGEHGSVVEELHGPGAVGRALNLPEPQHVNRIGIAQRGQTRTDPAILLSVEAGMENKGGELLRNGFARPYDSVRNSVTVVGAIIECFAAHKYVAEVGSVRRHRDKLPHLCGKTEETFK